MALEHLHAGVRVIGASATEIDFANALGANNNIIQIYSNSWGPRDDGSTVADVSDLINRVLEMATIEVIDKLLHVHYNSLTVCFGV